jgi:hypothetical protein
LFAQAPVERRERRIRRGPEPGDGERGGDAEQEPGQDDLTKERRAARGAGLGASRLRKIEG